MCLVSTKYFFRISNSLHNWYNNKKRVLRQLHSGETAHANNDVTKENQMAYDHIFHSSAMKYFFQVKTENV